MPRPFCQCECKMCRGPSGGHCRAHPRCGAPSPASVATHERRSRSEHAVADALARLKARSGSHSPSVAEIERAIPGLVAIDACFLSNPYATDEAVRRLRMLPPARLERMVCHYPSQSAAIAELLAPAVGVEPERLHVANGATEIIRGLLAAAPGPLVLPLPTFSAYYEFAAGTTVPLRLRPERDFALDFDELDALVDRYSPDTVVVINPNNPDGGLVDERALIAFAERTEGRVRQLIVDESFAAFASEDDPPTLAPLVADLPHLVVVNSLSKSHGIPGLRLGYAVMSPARVQEMRANALWDLNAFAEWFCGLLADAEFRRVQDAARRRYVREVRRLLAGLAALPGVTTYPSAANFALLELDRPAPDVATALLARHGVYVRDCGDKWGLDGDRFLRVAGRRAAENRTVLSALADVLASPPGANGAAPGDPLRIRDLVPTA